jgi:hypothetical protein
VLRDGLRNTSLTATEGAWDGASTALHSGEQGVEDTLTSQERNLTGKLLGNGTSMTHRPEMRQINFLLLSFVFEDNARLADSVVTSWHDFSDLTAEFRRNHDLVLSEDIIFVDETEDITSRNIISNLYCWVRSVRPLLVLIEARHINTTRYEHTLG